MLAGCFSVQHLPLHLQVVLASLQANEPIMFYCKAGKDRTGLLAMLILSVCEVPDDQILDDYHM
jgi:protein-tyrosine phosphatase